MRLRQLSEVCVVLEIARGRVNIAFSLVFTYNPKCNWVFVPSRLAAFWVSFMISGDGNFHIGDKVVYPNHGVGIIEQISSRTTGTTVERFYLLKIKASSAKVMVPFQNAATVGLRRVVRNGEAQKIVDYLTESEASQQRRLERPV